MKIIEIYGENKYEKYSKIREACRGIIVENDKILLSYEVNSDKWLIPGGGLEDGESIVECCIRELAEETGRIVDVNKEYLTIKEYYEDYLYISHYFICDYVGDTSQELTELEVKVGLEPRWINIGEVIDIFSHYKDYTKSDEEKRGAYLREYKALLEYRMISRTPILETKRLVLRPFSLDDVKDISYECNDGKIKI